MSPDQFCPVADLFPDPALLVTREGVVAAANRAAVQFLAADPTGRPLTDLAAGPADAVRDFLRVAARGRDPVPGRLDLRDGNGRPVSVRAYGSASPPGHVLVRLVRAEAAVSPFAALGQKVEELTREVHRRRRAEERLWERSELFRVTLASIGDAVITTDPAGVVTFVNPAAEALTGWAAAEAAGRPVEEVFRIVNEHTWQPPENPALRALRDGMIVGLANHTALIARDGRVRLIDDSAAPIRDGSGAVAGAVMVFRDVTDRRRAAEAQAFLAAIVESSDDAILSKALDGVILSWNAGAERLFGYTAEEAVGRPITLILPPDRIDEEAAILARLRRGERIDHYETVRLAKGGRPIHVSLTISPVRDSAGRIVAASNVTRDITGSKRAERDARFLADASAALASLVDEVSAMQKMARLAVPFFADWCAVDMRDGESLRRVAVAHVDPAKVQLAHELHRRYPPDPAAPHGIWHVVRAGEPELVPEITDEMLAATIRDPEQLRAIRELGLRSYMGVPVAARGKVLGAITFIAAESGRRYDSRDLAVAEDLARRAAVAVENARLYQALREADRRKDEFLATLAHELRNPLAPIRNGLEVMKQSGADPGQVRHAREVAERQVDHLTKLVNDLVDVSRIARGRIELRKEPVDLGELVTRAVEAARPTIDAEGHALAVRLPAGPVRLVADPVRLTQVLVNLLVNAARYTDRGGRIEVAAGREGDEAVVRVRDTGIGLAAESLGRVFEPFVQVAPAGHRSQGGLGIGLTLARSLAELHGGTVTAESPGPGRGSTFTVRLPLTETEPEGEKRREVGPEGERGKGGDEEMKPESFSPSPPRRVLVVDDNADAADSLAVLLRLLGHDVRVTHDGPRALAAAADGWPELVLLDIGMPGMDGYEVARRLRADPATAGAVLAALTGWGQEEDRRRSKEAGFDHHLVKPADLDMLQRLLAGLPARAP
jgi:PAS domain S-box-containing protein